MIRFRFAFPSPVIVAVALLLAGCSHGPQTRPQAIATAGKASDIDAAAALLDQGDTGEARKRLKAVLKRDPQDPSARVLLDSIERDPKDLLGPDSFAYTTKPGDTMTGLAQRFLGNRLKSYQLARYNGIAKPATLAAGQSLRIPGEPPRVAIPRPEPRPEPRSEPTRAPAASRARSAATARAKAPPATATAPSRNPALARQARGAGLAALNQGNVARAVALLGRAAQLDPDNPAIARDRQRAERIAATVRGRR